MMPSIELRIATMVRALREVIEPALAPDNPLAREQAQLVAAHLELLARQIPLAQQYEDLSLRATTALATRLVAQAAGGERTLAAAAALQDRLAARVPGDQSAAARRAALGAAMDALIAAAHVDASAAFRAALYDAVLADAARQALRDRAWFAANGLDPEQADLPDCRTALGLD